jgi:hypothetical protein
MVEQMSTFDTAAFPSGVQNRNALHDHPLESFFLYAVKNRAIA